MTRFSHTDDRGLHQQQGVLIAQEPGGDNLIYRHGGFLRVGQNGRYLTYSDGTPFFWLGDTWWRCPSRGVPLAAFQQMVDVRSRQGYTVFQAHGFRPIFPSDPTEVDRVFSPASGLNAFQALHDTSAEAVRYWREIDKYHAYANDHGMLGAMGFSGHQLLDDISLDELKRLWHYYLARYGAYAMTFLITQEYNATLGDVQSRVPKLLALGQFIHQVDPYQRAMSAHPWVLPRDSREAWSQPWHEFTMLQGGHRQYVNPRVYHEIWNAKPVKPMLECEANYEAFRNDTFDADAACIRRTAYSAIQCGSFGFTYGAQGLYAGVLYKKLPGPTAKWGPVLTWDEALQLPGGQQMQFLQQLYQSFDWWRFEPRPDAASTIPPLEPRQQILVKADGEATFLVYFPPGTQAELPCLLLGTTPNTAYRVAWFDPRTGVRTELTGSTTADVSRLMLPDRPDNQDWILIVRREKE